MRKRAEFQIEKIVAACDGDLHGAIRALMMVNEYLEGELVALQSALATGERSRRRANYSLH
ncbi:MAG: hypothetical protein E7813_24730 [Bradyrhizobium sp.]|uniref:hypothetical protein n=1 Tax=Bradyrhizobium sp. TaxID=376 RepID=UPI001224A807|nr:hypothetical protein [Bradyrhizobium sp.]THD59457.1 MAG: hypothetical protein E7813_24730 [Bradyrhizobium sp.]